jgi:hypothetical protein
MGGAPTEIEMTMTAPQPIHHDGTDEERRRLHELPPVVCAGMARLRAPRRAHHRGDRMPALASTREEELR